MTSKQNLERLREMMTIEAIVMQIVEMKSGMMRGFQILFHSVKMKEVLKLNVLLLPKPTILMSRCGWEKLSTVQKNSR